MVTDIRPRRGLTVGVAPSSVLPRGAGEEVARRCVAVLGRRARCSPATVAPANGRSYRRGFFLAAALPGRTVLAAGFALRAGLFFGAALRAGFVLRVAALRGGVFFAAARASSR